MPLIAYRRVAVRRPGGAGLTGRASAQGRPHRRRQRGGGGDRDGAGVRTRSDRPATGSPTARPRSATEMLRQARVEAIYLPPVFYLPSLSVALVLLLGGRAVIARHDDLRRSGAVHPAAAAARLAAGVDRLILDLSQRALASAGRTFSWLDEIPLLPEPPPDQGEAAAARSARGRRRSTTSTSPTPSGSEVLRGVRLRVEPDEIVAVCGRTGAGKSTLLSLLARHYDPTAARSYASRASTCRAMTLAELRSSVTVVTQRPLLFTETLRANLLAGRPDAAEPTIELACSTSWRGDVRRPAARRAGHDHRRARQSTSPAASASASRSPARCSRRRAGGCPRRPAVGGRHRG